MIPKKPQVKVIMGSIREGRLGEKVTQNVMQILKARDDADYEVVDLKDYQLPLFDLPVSPSMMTEPYTDEVLSGWQKKIDEADGFIIISPEYNHGYSSVLKNAIDYLYKEWTKKPIAFVSYGSAAGGSRAVEQLRLVSIELQMVPIRLGVHLPWAWEDFDIEGKYTGKKLDSQVSGMADQLSWWTRVLKNARKEDINRANE